MKKCLYCGKEVYLPEDTADEVYCSQQCKEAANRFLTFSSKLKIPMFIMLGISILFLMTGSFLPAQLRLVGIGLALMGLIAFVFPFSPTHTAENFGLKKTFFVARIVSIVILAFGVYMIVYL